MRERSRQKLLALVPVARVSVVLYGGEYRTDGVRYSNNGGVYFGGETPYERATAWERFYKRDRLG